MSAFKHILFPVDYSPRCAATIPFVKEMALKNGSQITLMNVAQTPPPTYGPPDIVWPGSLYDFDELRKFGQTSVEKFAREHFADLPSGVPVHRVCEAGDPALAIAGYAEAVGADLIMMATHGYGKFRALLLGSVAAKVLHDAYCPLWTGAHMEEAPSLGHLHIRNILCAIDLSKASRSVVRRALEVARAFSAAVRLIHTVPAAETRSEKYFETEIENVLHEAAKEEIVKLQEDAGTDVQVTTEGESVSKMVRSAAIHNRADLVVIGRGKLQAPFGRLRTHAYAIIRDAPCPVLSV